MPEYIDVTPADLADGTMREVKADGHDLLVARVGESYYVADAHCPHLHANLTKGTLDGTIVECPLHHSRFDLTDGHCVNWTNWSGTAKSIAEFTRHPRPLRVYETLVEGGRVLVASRRSLPESSPHACHQSLPVRSELALGLLA